MKQQQQSIDSSQPNFVMPDKWYLRKVDASSHDHMLYGFRVVRWIVSNNDNRPYCIVNEDGYAIWVEHIKFID